MAIGMVGNDVGLYDAQRSLFDDSRARVRTTAESSTQPWSMSPTQQAQSTRIQDRSSPDTIVDLSPRSSLQDLAPRNTLQELSQTETNRLQDLSLTARNQEAEALARDVGRTVQSADLLSRREGIVRREGTLSGENGLGFSAYI